MTHDQMKTIVAGLLKKRQPPQDFYERCVYNQSPEIAILNLYEWFEDNELAPQT